MKPSKKAIAKFQQKQDRVRDGQTANLVQDRKTGEMYDPQAKFDEMMNKPEIVDVLKRLTIR